jgi:hypothetical protein
MKDEEEHPRQLCLSRTERTADDYIGIYKQDGCSPAVKAVAEWWWQRPDLARRAFDPRVRAAVARRPNETTAALSVAEAARLVASGV